VEKVKSQTRAGKSGHIPVEVASGGTWIVSQSNRKGKTRHAAHASLARHHLLGIPFSRSSFQEGALLK